MKNITYLEMRKSVLRKLLDEPCFGQKQMLLENVAKYAGESQKEAKAVLNKLIEQGIVLVKKKHYGTHVWLNMKRFDEIKEILEGIG